ncbi:hypothetical protein KI387_031892, partial [Taxus chinensis]
MGSDSSVEWTGKYPEALVKEEVSALLLKFGPDTLINSLALLLGNLALKILIEEADSYQRNVSSTLVAGQEVPSILIELEVNSSQEVEEIKVGAIGFKFSAYMVRVNLPSGS